MATVACNGLKIYVSMYQCRSCESVNDTPISSFFKRYYETVRFTLRATRLSKMAKKYRFTRKECLMCHPFITLFSALKLEDDQQVHSFALHVFATIAMNLRDCVYTMDCVYIK